MQGIERGRKILANARSVVCFTGAGASAESGVPTFRGAQTGLWSRYDPQQLASPNGFAQNPGLVWRWYMWRLQLVQSAEPNAGHRSLAAFESMCSQFSLITQNVDDLHERAGSQTVLHLHGGLNRFRCNQCRHPHALDSAEQKAEHPPVCAACGDFVRPDVVWFGESLPHALLERAFALAETCDVMMVVGTSGVVYPAAQIPVEAKRAGAVLIEINPDPGPLSAITDIQLTGSSGRILPLLLEDLI